MLWLLLAALGLAAPTSDGAEAPAPAASTQASAERLRSMLGARSDAPSLQRDEVLAAVDARHPKVQAAVLNVDRAQGERRQAMGAFDPVLSAEGKGLTAGYYGYAIGDATVAWDAGPIEAWAGWRLGVDAGRGGLPSYMGEDETLTGGEARLGVSLDLLEGLVRNPERTRQRVAALGVDEAAAAQDATVVLVRRKAVSAWAKWVAAGRKLALENALLDVARARERAVEERIRLGDLAGIERVRNRQILAQREAVVAEARGEFTAATEQLALYLRASDGVPRRPTVGELPPRSSPPTTPRRWATDPVQLARAQHPALIAMRADLAARRAEARLARNARLPELSVQVEHARDLVRGSDPAESLRQPTTVVGLKTKVPLLNLKDGGKAGATAAKADKAAADLVWVEDQVEADVRSAMAREAAALSAWRAASETVELALQLQDGEQRRFDAGDIDLLRLWQVEQSTAKSISTEIEEWKRYQLAAADLDAAIGVTADLPVQ